ncbi:DUF5677 domain-containing protein [Lysinibacillus sp. FSL P4-0201]|uniref:DUF5677 domain-containing protein n=1 Tax=Lysinibacillus sp. FSL P4-0201 TaxID=2921721 RepID=UPI00315A8364
MDKYKTLEDISNSDVRYYMDSILKKIATELEKKYNNEDFGYLNRELMYLILIMFNKFKIQFYSVIKLTYDMTHDLENKYEYLDIVSINALQRTCYENYLIFHYIFISHEDFINNNSKEDYLHEVTFKYLLYKYDGYKQSEMSFEKIPEEKGQAKSLKKEVLKLIRLNETYKSMDANTKKDILERWRPSWNEIAKKTKLSIWNSKSMYNLLSQYSHTSYTSLLSINHYYLNLSTYDRDSMNLTLYQITTLFVKDICKIFCIDKNIFSSLEEGLMNEFYYLAQINPNEINVN